MKRILTLFSALALAVLLAAPAQLAAQVTLYVSPGATFPMGDFSDYAKTGWTVAGGVMYDIGPPGVAIGVDAFYGENKHEDLGGGSSDEKTNPYGAMGVVLYNFQMEGAITPYVFGGAGVLIHKFSGSFNGTDVSESESQFGYQGGAGVSYPLSPKVSLYGEGRFMGAKDTQFVGAYVGVAFNLGGGM